MDKHTEEVRPSSGTINFEDKDKIVNDNFVQILSIRTLEEMIENGYLFDEYNLPKLDKEISVKYETSGRYQECTAAISALGKWSELVDSGFDNDTFTEENTTELYAEDCGELMVTNSQILVMNNSAVIMKIRILHDYFGRRDFAKTHSIDKEGRILCGRVFNCEAVYNLEQKRWVFCPNHTAYDLLLLRNSLSDPYTEGARDRISKLLTDKLVLEPVDPPSGITIQQLEKYAPGIGEFLKL